MDLLTQIPPVADPTPAPTLPLTGVAAMRARLQEEEMRERIALMNEAIGGEAEQ